MSVVSRLENLEKKVDFLDQTLGGVERSGRAAAQTEDFKRLRERTGRLLSSIQARLPLWREAYDNDMNEKSLDWVDRSSEVLKMTAEVEERIVPSMQNLGLPTSPPIPAQTGVGTREVGLPPGQPTTPSPGRRGLPKGKEVSDPDVLQGQKDYWGCDTECETFVNMIKHTRDEGAFRVLALQGEANELESLIARLKKIWGAVKLKAEPGREHLHSHQALTPGTLRSALASQIINDLDNECGDHLREVGDKLAELCEKNIAGFENDEQMGRVFPQTQLARGLNECLKAAVGENRTVVLILEGFEKLIDSPTGRFLLEYWIIKEAPKVPGLVVVVTGEQGLDTLNKYKSLGINFFHVPTMTPEEYAEWAQDGFGFSFFTEELAQIVHSNKGYGGKAYPFRLFLGLLQTFEERVPGGAEAMFNVLFEMIKAQQTV